MIEVCHVGIRGGCVGDNPPVRAVPACGDVTRDGAANVVATLWRISDRGAADFAREFYRQLGKETAPAALVAAQRALMRDDRYGAPYYWAAYTLSGAGVIARPNAM